MNGKLKEHVCQKKGSAKERFWEKKIMDYELVKYCIYEN